MPSEKQRFGTQGEEMATVFLKEKGYSIIEKNFRKRTGEIDIIAWDPEWNEFVFVEVKTRRQDAFGYPEEAVTPKKIQKMARAAGSWLLKNNKREIKWRLDVVSIVIIEGKPEFYHLKNISL